MITENEAPGDNDENARIGDDAIIEKYYDQWLAHLKQEKIERECVPDTLSKFSPYDPLIERMYRMSLSEKTRIAERKERTEARETERERESTAHPESQIGRRRRRGRKGRKKRDGATKIENADPEGSTIEDNDEDPDENEYGWRFSKEEYDKRIGKLEGHRPFDAIVKFSEADMMKTVTIELDGDASSKSSKSVSFMERSRNYLINLMAIPVCVPFSPALACFFSNEYDSIRSTSISSSRSLMLLKKIYSDYSALGGLTTVPPAKNCDDVVAVENNDVDAEERKLTGEQSSFKRCLEESERWNAIYVSALNAFVRCYEKIIYEKSFNEACTAFFEFCAASSSSSSFSFKSDKEEEELRGALSRIVAEADTLTFEFANVTYYLWISLINSAECHCMNALILDNCKDFDVNVKDQASFYTTIVPQGDASDPRRHLVTWNCLESTEALRVVPEDLGTKFLTKNVMDVRRESFFEDKGRTGYVFGKGKLEKWNEMHESQVQYVSMLISDISQKDPGYANDYDKRANNPVFQFLSAEYSKRLLGESLLGACEAPEGNKLDALCMSSWVVLGMINAMSVRRELKERNYRPDAEPIVPRI
jgi:hypothetical protein